jgi:alkanesulfonate monooxygenase SsuD/methylene tetrahydromethanopterin reductase-like flavin-dependent oxidoreductase (luciferase family)
MRLQFGILASHQFPAELDVRDNLKAMFGLVESARDLGFDSVFSINHFVGNLVTAQTISVMARLIEISGSMRVGTGILILPLYHPLHIAEEFATLDQLSGGRIVLGVGVGYRDEEFDAFGIPKAERGARLEEGVKLIRELWSGKPVDFTGRFWSIKGHRIGIPPCQQGGPPIWIGAGARKAVERAARVGDAWLTPGNSPNPGYAAKHIGYYDAALAAVGKPTSGIVRPLLKEMYIAEDPAEARRDILDYLGREYRAYANYNDIKWFDTEWEGLLKNSMFVGSPEEVTGQMQAFIDMGFNHFILRSFWGGLPWQKAERALRLFAEKVRPHLKAS